MKQPVRRSVQGHGLNSTAHGSDVIGSGIFRVAVFGAVGFFLLESGSGSVVALLGAALGGLLGVLVILGRPSLLTNYFAVVILDSVLAGMVVLGGGQVFGGIFFLAALPVLWVRGPALAVVAACFSLVAYSVSLFVAGGFSFSSPESFLLAGSFGVYCGALGLMSFRNQTLQEAGRRTRLELESERVYSESVSGLALNFGPILEVLDLERILQWTAAAARDLVPARFSHVVVLDGNNHATSASEDIEVCPTWWNPALQETVLRGSRREGAYREPEKRAGDVRGFLAVPLRIPGSEHNGTLLVGGREFDEKDERVLMFIADQASSALTSAWESPGGRDFATGLPNRDSFYRVLDEMRTREEGVLTLVCLRFEGLWDQHRVDPEAERLLRVIGERIDESQRTFRYKFEELFVVLKSGGERRAERFCRWAEQTVAEAGRSSSCRLQVSVGYVIADPSEHDAASAVGRARRIARGVEVESSRFLPDVPEASDTVVAALLEAASIRDRGLAEHMKSVRGLARRIGAGMGLDRKEIDVLSLGAMLHDIGKIGVPDGVLKKPGKLTAEEFELIKRHTVMGAGVVAQIPHLSGIVPIVRHHHERHDGRGYPDGLAGKNVPLHARIVFVADAYDSMVQDRPYRRGLSHEEAVAEIEANAGTQFDPEVAEVFLGIAPSLRSERFRRRASGEAF
ncbi:GAF and HD-GYP domain-containing protein [Rubrobacter indicoceani]|uniref:GAF and HD-GYP domain-containing protein n=1 Tax=Rubrobacter indicoceani TaxID=2051957 RepID=UPI0013C4D88A|nr:HD domain-containing phosphohydrolase [Rubrobacter indicoceani]